MTQAAFWILVPAALITATISSVLGMAGGITLIGIMAATLPAQVVVPLHGIVQLFSNIGRTTIFLRNVRWNVFAVYALPAILGTGIAAGLYSGEKLVWFKAAIGLFILSFVVWRRLAPDNWQPALWAYSVLGLVAGFLAIFVGGTGPLLGPFFLREDFAKEEIIATKAACQTLTHLLKIPTFLALGFDYRPHIELLLVLAVAVLVGTLLGKRILHRISRRAFLLLFEVVLSAIGVYLVITGVQQLLG